MRLLPLLLLSTALAGCLSGGDGSAPEAPSDPAATAVPGYVAMDADALSQPVHAVGERLTTYVAGAGEVNLFVEWWLPDGGEGPWPTILHSTPYSHLDRPLGGTFYRDFYVERGYAVAVADVRGFGESGGCVTVWGPEEQQDQYDLVQWIAEQPWSDGNVGMVGVSYPGTTPIQAAVMAPPNLGAVVAVAGLTDPYFDWHFGGVPNGESSGSAGAYEGIGGVLPQNAAGGFAWATATARGGCTDPPVIAESYRTDGLYTSFYHDRNFSARVQNIEAPVLYSQGFTDGNVKPSQALNFFNEIPGVKKGFFGQWAHSNPQRPDWQLHELAWFDEHLKGIDTGILDGPVVEVVTNLDTWRGDTHWPPLGATPQSWFLHADGALSTQPAEADDLALQTRSTALDEGETLLVFQSAPLQEDLYLAGVPELRLTATIDQENAFWGAQLYDDDVRVSFAQRNSALRDSYETYRPVPVGEAVEYDMDFQPREWVAEAGSVLRLELRLLGPENTNNPEAQVEVQASVHAGETRLVLPVLEGRPDQARPYEDV